MTLITLTSFARYEGRNPHTTKYAWCETSLEGGRDTFNSFDNDPLCLTCHLKDMDTAQSRRAFYGHSKDSGVFDEDPEDVIRSASCEPIPVPFDIDACPECNRMLEIEVNEWESETGIPTEGGILVYCVDDSPWQPELSSEDRDGLDEHQHDQSEWLPVEAKVYEWAKKHVRIDSQPSTQEIK